jgi:mRNA interferase MazF
VRRGEVWLAQVGRKRRPVVVVTRDEVLDVRANVTVAEITTTVRGLAVEVPIDPASGIDQASVVNGDGLHTVSKRRLTKRLGSVDDETLEAICDGVTVALGWDRR